MLGGKLGATLVESRRSAVDDAIPTSSDEGRISAARWRGWCRCSCPTCCSGSDATGSPCSRNSPPRSCRPSSCPAKFFGTGTMQPIDYFVRLAEGASSRRPISTSPPSSSRSWRWRFRFHIPQYLMPPRRGLEGARLHRNAGRLPDAERALEILGRRSARRVQELGGGRDLRNPLDGRQGVNERIMLRELLRRVDMMVILENHLDALVRLHTPLPPGLIGGAHQPDLPSNLRLESLQRPERGTDRGAHPGGLCHHGLRSGVRA